MKIKAIILAGGTGKRLWPISRSNLPKQYIPFKENKSLLELTIERISTLSNLKETYIVTTQEQEKNIKKILDLTSVSIIIEPSSQNTAPALLLSILKLYSQDPDAVLLFLPCDHNISPTSIFIEDLNKATYYANSNESIVLLGVKPKWPSTEYGYIKYNKKRSDNIFQVNRFLEKPDKKRALQYYSKDNFLWNTGIFCAKASVFLKQFMDHAPDLLEKMLLYQKKLINYNEISESSFDKTILEKADNCVVIPASFDWCDVGNLENFINVSELNLAHKNNIICYNSNNNIIKNFDKTVILNNVNDLCIIQMNDLIFICPKSDMQNLNYLREFLKINGYENYL